MRQRRVVRNDANILAGTVELAAGLGWSGVTLAAAGRAAGLTIRPVRDRYSSRAALGAAAWESIAGPALVQALQRVRAGAGLEDEPADGRVFADAMNAVVEPSPELRAAAEFLVVSCFEPELEQAVRATMSAPLRQWLDPRAPDPIVAARRGYLLVLCLGLLAIAHRPGITVSDFTDQWPRFLDALGSNTPPRQLPTEQRPPHIAFVPFDTGDPTTDALLRACLDHLGRFGYERASLPAIADDAGVSEGAIYLRYPTKEAFVRDALRRQQDIAMPSFRAHIVSIEQRFGTGVAEAVTIRDTMHPREHSINVIEMERVRLAWHRPEVLRADEERLQSLVREVLAERPDDPDFADPARLHIGRAVGIGISFLPLLTDAAWDLPYDVITVPLAGN